MLVFTNKYYELAMALVGMDPENDDDFNDEEKVMDLLYERFSVKDINGFENLIERLKVLDSSFISVFNRYIEKGYCDYGRFCKKYYGAVLSDN